MLSKCNFSISGFLLVLGLHESRPNMENIFQLPVSPDRAAVILSSGRGDWADLQTHPVPALWCQMVQISRLILSIINSIFNLFSVSEYSISKLTNGIRGRCGTKSWDSERRDREEPFASQSGRGSRRERVTPETWPGGRLRAQEHWSPVTSSYSDQWSARARGLRGVVSGHQWGTCHVRGQCWSMGTRAGWGGHSMVRAWSAHVTTHRGLVSQPCALVSAPLPLDARFLKFAETREKLWQNLVPGLAWPHSAAEAGMEWADLFWYEDHH